MWVMTEGLETGLAAGSAWSQGLGFPWGNSAAPVCLGAWNGHQSLSVL
jgi:hypothetical protein